MKNSYTESLAHTTWECKYHIVFAPKYRRQEIYGELKKRDRTNNKRIMFKKRSSNTRGRGL